MQQGLEQYQYSQFQEALQSWEQALETYRQLGDHQGEEADLGNLGLLYNSLGQYERSIDFLQQALAIARDLGDSQGEEADLGNLGLLYNSLDQYERGIDFLQQALAIARKIGDRQGEANSLGNLGLAYGSLGQYEQGIDFLQQALAIEHKIGDQRGEANSLGNLGLAYRSLGQYERGINLLQQALAIEHKIGDRRGEASDLSTLGNTYVSLGQYNPAINSHQQALTIHREIGDRQGEADSLGNLGVAYYSLGRYEQAIDFLQQALTIDQELGDRQGEANSLGDLGLAYSSLGQYKQAIDFHQQALAIDREISYRQGEAADLGNLGLAYDSQGRYGQAIDFYQQALAIDREIGDLQGQATDLENQGVALGKIGQFSQAESLLRQSINVYESLRTDLPDNQLISIADTQATAYAELQSALMAQGKTNESLATSERGRARAFVWQLAKRITAGDPQATQLAKTLAHPPGVSEIQQIACDTHTTLVTYSLFSDQALYIWVVSPSGDIQFRVVNFKDADNPDVSINPIVALSDGPLYRGRPDNSELTTLVSDLRATIAIESTNRPDQLKALYQTLIAPIADLLPTDPAARVAFIPQGNLFLVPFAALQAPDGTYLIQNHTILTAPSIQVFGLASQAAASRSPLTLSAGQDLIVGDPTMPTVEIPDSHGSFTQTQLPDLPGAKAEAEAIGQFLHAPVLVGDQASEARVKQQITSAQLIHLATHGLLDYGDPQAYGSLDLPGAIALAPSGGEDGLLTSAEILSLPLQAKLAVLSACDTGRGRITSDGVVGLSRSLITAGVPSVVVSLWSVNDASTQALMTEFYRQLDQGQDNAQALRQGMLTTMRQYPDPRNWAAFTLIGAAE
ncbi:CHAT domain-containing tetratricopeptide repeat protein [Nodosilinea nodulosa]|uniref:CHAT domain-containing tetratricopeptide repeat protein n=1 Tax=Nodosilinea nodulosa TaxID=416001 RepID=UPI0018C2EFF1|nr:CHAT domain-containing tetratricopeptide repeat protein [Nodosilinea nodulosa]